MVSCECVIAMLVDYDAGTLPESLRAEVDRHLCSCLSCSKETQDYLTIIRLAGHLPRSVPPPDAEQRLRDLIEAVVSAEGLTDGLITDLGSGTAIS